MNKKGLIVDIAGAVVLDQTYWPFQSSMSGGQSHPPSAEKAGGRELRFELLLAAFGSLHDIPIGRDDRSPRAQNLDLLALDGIWCSITHANLDVMPVGSGERMERALGPKNWPLRPDIAAVAAPRHPEASESHKQGQNRDCIRSGPTAHCHLMLSDRGPGRSPLNIICQSFAKKKLWHKTHTAIGLSVISLFHWIFSRNQFGVSSLTRPSGQAQSLQRSGAWQFCFGQAPRAMWAPCEGQRTERSMAIIKTH